MSIYHKTRHIITYYLSPTLCIFDLQMTGEGPDCSVLNSSTWIILSTYSCHYCYCYEQVVSSKNISQRSAQATLLVGEDLGTRAVHSMSRTVPRSCLLLAGSLWQKGAYHRTILCMKVSYPYAIKNQRRSKSKCFFASSLCLGALKKKRMIA